MSADGGQAGPAEPSLREMEQVDEFLVVERAFSDDAAFPTFGLANIGAAVPGIEENKTKIERACKVFAERGVNVAIFPEFCVSGHLWDDEESCFRHLEEATTEQHLDWIDERLRPLLDDTFRAIVLNNPTRGRGRKYHNTTFIVSDDVPDPLARPWCYHKAFLTPVEKRYMEPGGADRLIVKSPRGGQKLGFTTCYDYLFNDLLREYSVIDGVDAIVEMASWRAVATRDYPGMNVRTDMYYGQLWDTVIPAASATNQVWTIACNAVGRHGMTGDLLWGGSGIWAPSGLKLIQASNFHEELLVVRNVDLAGAMAQEHDDFDYGFDFSEVYRPMENGLGYTRGIPLSEEPDEA